MVLLKQLFKEACDKFGYDDFYRLESTLTTKERLDGSGGLEYLKSRKLQGDSLKDIARDFHVKPTTISFYLAKEHNTTWRELTEYHIHKGGTSPNGKQLYVLVRTSDNKIVKSSIFKDKLLELVKMEE